jgi:hypothetical protein
VILSRGEAAVSGLGGDTPSPQLRRANGIRTVQAALVMMPPTWSAQEATDRDPDAAL